MLDDERPVAAVARALRILDAFEGSEGALSLVELSNRTGLYKSTILRLALTLEASGYLSRNSQGLFVVGSKPLRLAAAFQKNVQPAEAILLPMQEAVRKTGESASYFIERGSQRICIYRVDSPQLIRDHIVVGDVFPMDRGAGARVIAAYRKPYDEAYSKLRQHVVASAESEVTPDMASVAAPVFDCTGNIVAALTLSGPSARFNKRRRKGAERTVLSAACQITSNIGGDITEFLKRSDHLIRQEAALES